MRRRAVRIYFVLLLFYCMMPFGMLLGTGLDLNTIASGQIGSGVSKIIQFVMLITGIVLVLLPGGRIVARGAREASCVLLLPVLAVTSTLWSSVPSVTAVHSINVIVITLLGLYLGQRFRRDEQLALLCNAILLAAVLSLVFVFAFPSMGISHDGLHNGNWQGIFHQKNMLCRMMSLGLLASFVAIARATHRTHYWICLCLCVLLVVESRSAAAFVALAVLIPAAAVFRTFHRHVATVRTVLVVMLAFVLGATVWLSQNFAVFLGILGRDATLTSRTVLWKYVWLAIGRHPWLGYGFDGFWHGLQGPSATVLLSVHWGATFSHNGVLEFWLQFGLVGILVFLLGYLPLLKRAWRTARFASSPTRIWPLLYLGYLVMFNISDSSGLAVNSIFLLLYIALAATPYTEETLANRVNLSLPSEYVLSHPGESLH